MKASATWYPGASLAMIHGEDGRQACVVGIHSQEEAEAAATATAERWDAEDAAEAERKSEHKSRVDAEAIKQAVAKATATPHFLASLTFLKLIKYRDTCPYFDEIRAELDRLAQNDFEV